jgi:hypothetical protein
MQEQQTYLKNDMTFVELYIGLGGIHYDLDGLKQSHMKLAKPQNSFQKSKEQIIFHQLNKKAAESALYLPY